MNRKIPVSFSGFHCSTLLIFLKTLPVNLFSGQNCQQECRLVSTLHFNIKPWALKTGVCRKPPCLVQEAERLVRGMSLHISYIGIHVIRRGPPLFINITISSTVLWFSTIFFFVYCIKLCKNAPSFVSIVSIFHPDLKALCVRLKYTVALVARKCTANEQTTLNVPVTLLMPCCQQFDWSPCTQQVRKQFSHQQIPSWGGEGCFSDVPSWSYIFFLASLMCHVRGSRNTAAA